MMRWMVAVLLRPEVEHSSLIRVREHFDEKVLNSADALESAAVS